AFDDRLAVHAHRRHVDGGAGDGAVRQFVVEGAGEDAGGGRLADAAHAGEDPGLRDAAAVEGVGDGADHRLLADQVLERGRAVFAREDAVAALGRGGTRTGRVRGFAHRDIRRRGDPRVTAWGGVELGGRLTTTRTGLVRAASF